LTYFSFLLGNANQQDSQGRDGTPGTIVNLVEWGVGPMIKNFLLFSNNLTFGWETTANAVSHLTCFGLLPLPCAKPFYPNLFPLCIAKAELLQNVSITKFIN
jgi:hypothetical protein